MNHENRQIHENQDNRSGCLDSVGNRRNHALGSVLAKTHGCKCTVENHKVVLTISDDGEGIAKEDVLHIFDRFYTGKNGKTGIGLALTKEIAKLHGGDVKAYNRNGAVFEMILPQAKTSINC